MALMKGFQAPPLFEFPFRHSFSINDSARGNRGQPSYQTDETQTHFHLHLVMQQTCSKPVSNLKTSDKRESESDFDQVS